MQIKANSSKSYAPPHDTNLHSPLIAHRGNTKSERIQKTAPWRELHLARDITVLQKLKLSHPPPRCLDTPAINSHYIDYKTIEIQDHLNPSQHCQGAPVPLPTSTGSQ